VRLRLGSSRRAQSLSLQLGSFHMDDTAADGARATPFRELLAPCSPPGGATNKAPETRGQAETRGSEDQRTRDHRRQTRDQRAGGPPSPSSAPVAPMLLFDRVTSTLGEPPCAALPHETSSSPFGWPSGVPPTHQSLRIELANSAMVLLSELLADLSEWSAAAAACVPRTIPEGVARQSHPQSLRGADLWICAAEAEEHRNGRRVPPPHAPPPPPTPATNPTRSSADASRTATASPPPSPRREPSDTSTWRGLEPWSWADEVAARESRAAALAPRAALTEDSLQDALLLRGARRSVTLSLRNVFFLLPCAADGTAAFRSSERQGWAFCVAVSNHKPERLAHDAPPATLTTRAAAPLPLPVQTPVYPSAASPPAAAHPLLQLCSSPLHETVEADLDIHMLTCLLDAVAGAPTCWIRIHVGIHVFPHAHLPAGRGGRCTCILDRYLRIPVARPQEYE